MFIEAKDDGGGGDNWTTGAICEVYSNLKGYLFENRVCYQERNALLLYYIVY